MTNAGKHGETTGSDVFAFVPSYNHAPFVEQCLRSIFAQSKSPRKLLVIDDGSKDDSPAIIEKTLKDCPFDSELIVRENRGLCRTLNEGLELSRGEYFAYISSDDVWLPQFLQSRAALLDLRPDAVLAYGHALIIDDEGFITDKTTSWGGYADVNATEMLLRPTIPTSASVVYRRSALIGNSWNDDSVLEDYDLYLRLSVAGEFALDDRTLSAWRIHDSNTSADVWLMMNEWLRAQERLGDTLGLDGIKLKKAQEEIKFNSIPTFARNRNRKMARSLLHETGKSFPLTRRIGMQIRIAIPDWLYDSVREVRHFVARRKYGHLYRNL